MQKHIYFSFCSRHLLSLLDFVVLQGFELPMLILILITLISQCDLSRFWKSFNVFFTIILSITVYKLLVFYVPLLINISLMKIIQSDCLRFTKSLQILTPLIFCIAINMFSFYMPPLIFCIAYANRCRRCCRRLCRKGAPA